jgi:CheY-like chemotaxis protein
MLAFELVDGRCAWVNVKLLQRVLYVEDDPSIQIMARFALEDIGGFDLRTCVCGGDALAVLTEFNPDLVLLDVMMPGMDGPQTLQAIRSVAGFDKLPAVFLTALSQQADIARLKGPCVLDVIVKPFDVLTLAAHLRELWRGCGGSGRVD